MSARGLGPALAVTVGTEVVIAMPVGAVSVLAPVVAAGLEVPPSLLGIYMATIWSGALVTSMVTGALLARRGPVRVLQLCLATAALGAFCIASGRLGLMALGAVLMGMAVGPEVPTGVQLLMRLTTPANRAFVLSVKLSGWQIGTALLGAVGPGLAAAFGWQGTVAILGAACLAAALAQEPARRRLDADNSAKAAARVAVLDSVRAVLRSRELKRLNVAAVVLTIALNVYVSFVVLMMVVELGFALAFAGTVFGIAQLGAMVGRMGCGIVAGRWVSPGVLLALIGFGMAVLATALGASSPSWPVPAVAAIVVAFATVGGGWFGVCLSEAARLSPPDQAGLVTSGLLVFHFLTIILAPLIFAGLAAMFGYGWAFVIVGIATAVGLMPLLVPARAPRTG